MLSICNRRKIVVVLTHFVIILVINRVIVIENRQKIFQLQLQLLTFEKSQLQLQLQQSRVINYSFVINYKYKIL